MFYLFPYIRFDPQTGTLDRNLRPPRPARRQTDPGGRAEDQASPECRQPDRGGPPPGQPDVPRQQGLPNTAAARAAHRISVGHVIAQLEGVQHDGAAAELAQAQGDGEDATQEAAEEDERGKEKEETVAPRHVRPRDGGTRARFQRAGLAGHLLIHRLQRKVKGEGDSAPHGRTVQVFVSR